MSHYRTQFSLARSALYVSLAAALLGCGGTGQDTGQQSNYAEQTLSGRAVDGYLARALVFIDYDNNSTRDPWEPFAFTDDDGYYSFNPETDTNYCAEETPAESKIFCLRSKRSRTEAVIRVDGGYDVSTGEPFYGQMSRRISLVGNENSEPTIISPLTTLLTQVSSVDDRAAILASLGIGESDLDVDYLNVGNDAGVDGALLNTAIKLHKTISISANYLASRYEKIGKQTGAANDLTSSVYRHLARELVDLNINLDSLLADSQSLAAVLQRAEADARSIYDQWEIPLPAASTSQQGWMNYSPITLQSSQLALLIDELTTDEENLADAERLKGAVRLVETIMLKAMRDPQNNGSFQQAMTFLRSSENRALTRELIASLAAETADIDMLANRSFTSEDFGTIETIRTVAQLPQNAEGFANIANRRLRVSNMDLGHAPNSLKDSEVEFYFHGGTAPTQGRFDACVKYIEDANVNGKLGEANTRGELVKGYWSLLGAGQNNGRSYSLLITIDFLGTTYQAILKPSGMTSFGQNQMHALRFDYAGDLKVWHSANGFEPLGDLPQTRGDCIARLPSRIGI